jgi:hypothetical protein
MPDRQTILPVLPLKAPTPHKPEYEYSGFFIWLDRKGALTAIAVRSGLT